MRITSTLSVLAATVALTSATAAPQAPAAAPAKTAAPGSSAVAGDRLPNDPKLVMGQLPNGMHYVVRSHNNPPGRAIIWLHMHTGSMNESDRQRGIAHYTEHMAFNGSEHFPPGALIPFFESLGMTFGRDQNAFTNMEETTYQLSLPQADPTTLGKGMTFFADVVCNLSLLPKEIDDERQIILEERRRGLSGRQRVGDIVRQRMAPGSLYAMRETIGLEETIKGVNPQDFRDYYSKWYMPSNATLIVIADQDPAEVVKVIKEKFEGLPTKPKPVPQAGGVKPYTESFAVVVSDPEIRTEDIRIARVGPAYPPTTTEAQYRHDLVMRLGDGALNRRFTEKAARGGTSYLNARASSGDQAMAIHTTEISARPQNGKWRDALSEMALELQRARTFGFTQHEIDEGRTNMMSAAERAVETESTATASGLMGRINSEAAQGEPMMSAAQRLELLKKILPTITVEEVSKTFADEFNPKAVAFIATLPGGEKAAPLPTEAEVLEAGMRALAQTPTKEEEVEHAKTLMTTLPKGGKMKEGAEHTATGIWTGWLDNNIRVQHRFMDEQKNEATVRISLIGGEMLEDASNRGITSAAQLAWSRPATRHLTSADIRELMTGKKVSVGGGGFGGGGRGGRGGRGGGGGGGADSIALTIAGSPEEMETGFQLAYLLLTEPLIEKPAFDQHQTTAKEMLDESNRAPQGVAGRIIAALPYPENEVRMHPATAEQIDHVTQAKAQEWLEKLIKESPIEVTIVGDINRDRALELVSKYLGSLPSRDRVSPQTYAFLRKIARPAGPHIVEKEIDTPTDQAVVFSGFYGTDESNRADARALSMAARILSMRMTKQVREEDQLVYSISAGSRTASTYPGFGVFSASAPTDPTKVPALVAKLKSMYEEFAAKGPSEEEVETAKKQYAKTWEAEIRTPGFWSGRMNHLLLRGASLDDILKEPEQYQALTAAQVRETFAKYYKPDAVLQVVVKPSQASAAAAGAAKEKGEEPAAPQRRGGRGGNRGGGGGAGSGGSP